MSIFQCQCQHDQNLKKIPNDCQCQNFKTNVKCKNFKNANVKCQNLFYQGPTCGVRIRFELFNQFVCNIFICELPAYGLSSCFYLSAPPFVNVDRLQSYKSTY